MRIIGWALLMVLLVGNSVFAMAPVNRELIKEAQDYGVTNFNAPLQDFLLPWTAYEERAIRLDDNSERAYLYTSFLLIASDAREKRLSSRPVIMADSENILADYAGFLTVSVHLRGATAHFARETTVIMRQGNKLVNPNQVKLSEPARVAGVPGKYSYDIQGFFYFLEKDINTNKPVTVIVTTADKKEHRFYFDLAATK